jgi:acetyltransferase-like isoleucine patch superfamily enzyme/lysophospholipase L1-like esterase
MPNSDDQALIAHLKSKFGTAIRVGHGCDFASDFCVEIDEGGLLVLGERVSIRRGSTIQVHRGATVVIGNDVALGENTFISAMVGIMICDGVGISNMVDFHDHNHRERSNAHASASEAKPWSSGFVGAPIIVESGVTIANKVSVTAGVRIGQNAIVGANSVVARSLPPNTVSSGAPARTSRRFDGIATSVDQRQTLRFSWFGTSIMEHLEGYNAQMANQANLPPIGSSVVVEEWRKRGYVQRLQFDLQVKWPHLEFDFENHGEGGATSRDVLKIARSSLQSGDNMDVAFVGCGINDVWRQFQGRHSEAVSSEEFVNNYDEILRLLSNHARRVVCIGETPFGWADELDIQAMNAELLRYNGLAARVAADAGVPFIHVWTDFCDAGREFARKSFRTAPQLSLWSDGVHLSDHGDALMLHLVHKYLWDSELISDLTRLDLYERELARNVYQHMFSAVRGEHGPH